MVEHRLLIKRLQVLILAGVMGEFYFLEVSVLSLILMCHSTVAQNPGHSAKGVGDTLQLNVHSPLTQ